MSTFTQNAKYGAAVILATATTLSHAALDTLVTTAMTDAKADILALGAIVFGISVAVVVYKWLKRAL